MGSCLILKKRLANKDTFTPTSLSSSIDMGINNTYRYINTLNIPQVYSNMSRWWGSGGQRDLTYTVSTAGKYFILGCRYDPDAGSQSGIMENSSWLGWGDSGWYSYTRSASIGTKWTYRCSAQGAIFVIFRYNGI